MNNIVLNALNILNEKPLVSLKKSLAKLHGRALIEKWADPAICRFNELKADAINYYLNVQEMNYAGYLQLTLTNPANSFPYCSYGLGLEQSGKKTETIMMYKKTLRVNADDQYVITALKCILER